MKFVEVEVSLSDLLEADFAGANVAAAFALFCELILGDLAEIGRAVALDNVGAGDVADDPGQAAVFRRQAETFDQHASSSSWV